jgi:hypothetical protein
VPDTHNLLPSRACEITAYAAAALKRTFARLQTTASNIRIAPEPIRMKIAIMTNTL